MTELVAAFNISAAGGVVGTSVMPITTGAGTDLYKTTVAQMADAVATLVFSGARVYRGLPLTQTTADVALLVEFDLEQFDVGGWHEGITNPARLTVPAGTAFVRVGGNAYRPSAISDSYNVVWLRHYDSSDTLLQTFANNTWAGGASGLWFMQFFSGPVAVSAGDYFVMEVQSSAGGLGVLSGGIDGTEFWIEKAG